MFNCAKKICGFFFLLEDFLGVAKNVSTSKEARLLCHDFVLQTREEGRFYLEYARDNYRGYDFEGRLNVRIQAALRYYSEDVSERNAQALISN